MARVPVVMLDAYGQQERVPRAAGVHYLLKDAPLGVLVQAIESAAAERQADGRS